MLNLKKLLFKSPQTEQGFTMLEVLMGILITSAFLAVSMQGMVIATFFRVKAQEKQIASQLIQKDIESVKFAANNSQSDLADSGALPFAVDSRCSASTDNDGFAKAVWEFIYDNPGDSSADDNYIAVPSPMNILTKNQYQVGETNSSQGKWLALERIRQNSPTAPYRVLKVKYRVSEWSTTTGDFVYTDEDEREANAIAKDYIEVIPNDALLCP